MSKVRRTNIITISVILVILVLLSIFCLFGSMVLPKPDNAMPIFVTWVCGVAVGLYIATLMITVGYKS